MKIRSEYIRNIRDFLKKYNQWRATLDNLESTAEEWRQELERARKAAPCHRESIAGDGQQEPGAMEAKARCERIEKEIQRIEGEIESIKRTLVKIDDAIDRLDNKKKRLVKMNFFEYRTGQEMAEELGQSESWVLSTGRKAICEIAYNFYGIKAIPPEKRATFLTW